MEEQGAFRRPKKAKAFWTGFQAKYGDKEELDKVQNGTLLKAKGDERLIDVKSVLPVPAGTDTSAERLARTGAADRQRREKTSDLIGFVKEWIGVNQTRPLRNLGPHLRRSMADGVYDKTLQSVNRNLAGVLELWPKDFELKAGQGKPHYYVKSIR